MCTRRLTLSVVFLCGFAAPALAQKLDLDEIERSIGYVNDLQNPDGGFRPAATDKESDLGTMNAALRAIKYFHPQARPRNRDAMPRFVDNCYHADSGGFSAKPGGKPDVRSTAMGLMVMAELKLDLKERGPAITQYFVKHAESAEEIYIAAAALHAAELPPPANVMDWIAEFDKTANSDGSYGTAAIDSASAINTILRLGGTMQMPRGAVRAVRLSQQDDGGFGKPNEPSDLATTYRCMRALGMFKVRPKVDPLRGFIARCRNADGGYGLQPGQPSTVSATYFAAIVMHWLEES